MERKVTMEDNLESSGGSGIAGGKFLSFRLFEEDYALDALRVVEIVGIIDITPVPQTPDFVKGVINLRGKVIPVVDLRIRFNMPEENYTDETCIIVVEVGELQMGVIIDTVLEVLDIDSSDIEPPPSFGVEVNTDYIYGMGKIGGKAKILLNIDKVLTSEELVAVGGIQTEEQ